jgi:hypothetical protein
MQKNDNLRLYRNTFIGTGNETGRVVGKVPIFISVDDMLGDVSKLPKNINLDKELSLAWRNAQLAKVKGFTGGIAALR